MKRQMKQSSSTILEDDTGFNHNEGKRVQNGNPFRNDQSQKKERKNSDKSAKEDITGALFKQNEKQSLENNLLLSGGAQLPNKDFAGETFSQISSTFDQQPLPQQVSNQIFYKIQKLRNGNADKILISANEYANSNHDDLLDDDILNKSSSFEKSTDCQKGKEKKVLNKRENNFYKNIQQEYEINQRVSFLEEAYRKQQDEINKLANRNEDLKREKQLLSKKYEKRMIDIEETIKLIIHNLKENPRSVDKHQKINHSFSIGNSYQTLLQPDNLNENKKDKNQNANRNKENVCSVNESREKENIKGKYKVVGGYSLQSQLLNLKRMIKEFKKTDFEQNNQIDQSQKQNSFDNLWNHIRTYKNQSEEQQSQNFLPQDSLASVNQAFIQSRNTKDQKSYTNSQNNTSFFGKEWQNDNKMLDKMQSSQAKNYLNEVMTNENNELRKQLSEEELIFCKNRLSDLSCTQQQRFIELVWMNKLQNEELGDNDRRDVKLEEILEISKTINNSVMSSFRTGRQNQNGFIKKSSKDLNQQQNSFFQLLRQFNSNEAMSNLASQQNLLQQKGDKNNSTLEISFNQNEIQTVDGLQQVMSGEKKFYEEDNSIQNFLKLDDKISNRDLKNKPNHAQFEEQKIPRQNLIDNNRIFQSMEESIDLQMGGGIADSFRNEKTSVEQELKEFGDIFAKKSQQMLDFPEYSIIEGNSIENKKDKCSLSGSIEKQGGESYFLAGDSLVDMDQAFHLDKKESTLPMPIMTIKVQDREIKMPQLNLKKAIDMERREPYKFKQDSEYQSSPSLKGLSITEQPSSFQNESISKQNIPPEKLKEDQSQNEGTLDLDKAIIVEEVKNDKQNQNSEDNSLGHFENMFGSFQQELQREDQKNHNNQDDTLDLNDMNFSDAGSNKKELPNFKESKSNSKEKQKDLKEKMEDTKEKSFLQVNQSQNLSYLKKSHSDSQLINLAEINMANEELKKIENESLPENLNNHFLDSNKEQESDFQSKNGQFNVKKIKTPKNAIKINFNQLNQNQGLKMMVSKQQQNLQNHTKKRSTSSETRKIFKIKQEENQKLENSGSKSKNIKIITYNDEDDSKQGSEKKSIKLKGTVFKINKLGGQGNNQNLNLSKIKVKLNPNQHSMLQPNMNEISCNQDQSLVANSFFYQDMNFHSNRGQLEEIKEDQEAQQTKVKSRSKQSQLKVVKRQKNEEESMLVSKADESQLASYYNSAAFVSQGNSIIIQKTKKSTSIRRPNPYQEQPHQAIDNTFSRASNMSSFQQKQTLNSCEFNIAPEIQENYGQQNSPFLESPPKNQRQSKSLVNQSKRVAINKIMIQKAGVEKQISVNQVNKKRISVQKRRVQENDRQNDLINQTDIYEPKINQSVIQKHSYNIQNVSQIVSNQNESLMINKTHIEDQNSIIGPSCKKIIKIAMRSNERKVASKLKQQQQEIVQQPQIQLSNISINDNQLTTQKSFPKFLKHNQKQNPQPYQAVEDHSKSLGPNSNNATKILHATKGVSQDKYIKRKTQDTSKDETSTTQIKKRPNSSKLRKKSGTTDTMQILRNYKQPRKTTDQMPLSQASSMKNL